MIEKTYSFTRGGETVDVYTLKNKSGMEMDVMTFGGRILRLTAPDRNGKQGDVIMGYARPEDYFDKPHAYYGAFIGRSAGRNLRLTELNTNFIPTTVKILYTAVKRALT